MGSTLLRGGKVYDHETNQFLRQDVLIVGETVARIAASLDETADEIIEAEGQYISAGWIDLHCHIFDHPLYRTTRLAADRIGVTHGVTCLVDTGSAGAVTIDAFKQFVIDTQHTRAFALCNIGSPGQPGIVGGHSATPELVSLAGTVRAIERNPSWVLGVKVLASSSHTGLMGIEAVKMARKAAELTDTPLMIHIGNAPPVIDEVLALARPGDIITHAYHGKVGGVLGHGGKVIPAFRDAVERGIVVDIAHGRSSFSFATCEQALDQGMPVHTISSDLHAGNINRYVVSLPRTMSKFRLLGLTLEDVIRAVTLSPAKALDLFRFGIGTLSEGGAANITVFSEVDKAVEVEDSEGVARTTRKWIEPHLCYVRGEKFTVSSPL